MDNQTIDAAIDKANDDAVQLLGIVIENPRVFSVLTGDFLEVPVSGDMFATGDWFDDLPLPQHMLLSFGGFTAIGETNQGVAEALNTRVPFMEDGVFQYPR